MLLPKRTSKFWPCTLAAFFCWLPAADAADSNYEQGVTYFKAKDYSRAAKYFELAMRRNPADANALYYDAQCYDQLGENARAKALYQHCLNIFPASPVAGYAQQILNSRRPIVNATKAEPAREEPASVVSEDPIRDLLKRGNALDEQGNKSEAEKCFLDALNLAERGGSSNPKISDALESLGDISAERGNFANASKYYQREMQMRERLQGKSSPDIAQRMKKQAEFYQRDGDLSAAEDLLRRSSDIYQSQYDKAEHAGTRLVDIRENLSESLNKLAGVLRAEKRFQEATNVDNQLKSLQMQN